MTKAPIGRRRLKKHIGGGLRLSTDRPRREEKGATDPIARTNRVVPTSLFGGGG